jgi:hypothetical protein
MKSPWTKKNPWMSMYLSGANAVAGAMRGRISSAIKRQATTSLTRTTKQLADAWTDVFLAPSTKKRRGKRR